MIWAYIVSLTMKAGHRYSGWRWKFLAQRVRERDNHVCTQCGFHASTLDVHHIRPLAAGGSHWPGNLASLCRACHEATHGYNFGQPKSRQDRSW